MKVSSAGTPPESERTERPRRWLAGAACGALLAVPIAVTSLPAPAAAAEAEPMGQEPGGCRGPHTPVRTSTTAQASTTKPRNPAIPPNMTTAT